MCNTICVFVGGLWLTYCLGYSEAQSILTKTEFLGSSLIYCSQRDKNSYFGVFWVFDHKNEVTEIISTTITMGNQGVCQELFQYYVFDCIENYSIPSSEPFTMLALHWMLSRVFWAQRILTASMIYHSRGGKIHTLRLLVSLVTHISLSRFLGHQRTRVSTEKLYLQELLHENSQDIANCLNSFCSKPTWSSFLTRGGQGLVNWNPVLTSI